MVSFGTFYEANANVLQSKEHVVSLTGSCVVDVATNSLQVTEGGRVVAKVSEDPFIEKEARLMYSGMTGVLSASRPLEGVQVQELGPGVCGYTFTLPLDIFDIQQPGGFFELHVEAELHRKAEALVFGVVHGGAVFKGW